MVWLDFIALILATGAPINAWMEPDGLFAGWREWLIAWGDIDRPEDASPGWQPTRWQRVKNGIGKLAQCRFCQHYHVPYLLLIFLGISLFLVPPWDTLVKFPIYSLAVTRTAYQLSRFCREEEHDESS